MTSGSPPPVIVASHHRAEREITGHFLAFHAISPGDAVAFTPTDPVAFQKMLASGAVKQASKGLYWLDVAAYRKDVEARRARLVPAVIMVSLLVAAALLYFYVG